MKREFPRNAFADVLAANEQFVHSFSAGELSGVAALGLAIITCMDSRISPLSLMGMKAGDAKILRNAGARVTDDVLRTLVLATYLLGVRRVLVMPHTECRMTAPDDSSIHATIGEKFGVNTRSLEFRTTSDVRESLAHDVERVRAFPLLPADLEVGGAVYDVRTGRLEVVDC
ncbi:MAG: beta-class carbonic anhydrase [Ilumatobacteraceae bacterium]